MMIIRSAKIDEADYLTNIAIKSESYWVMILITWRNLGLYIR